MKKIILIFTLISSIHSLSCDMDNYEWINDGNFGKLAMNEYNRVNLIKEFNNKDIKTEEKTHILNQLIEKSLQSLNIYRHGIKYHKIWEFIELDEYEREFYRFNTFKNELKNINKYQNRSVK
ncbi:MAG: hypothetical protein ACRCX2_37145 [Paraclostridium sp.]